MNGDRAGLAGEFATGSERRRQGGLGLFGTLVSTPWFALTLIALGVGMATFCGAALSWDGGARLFTVLDQGRPDAPHLRLVNVVLQLPALLAAALGPDEARIAFNLAYSSVPLLALLAAWAVVGAERPGLFVWPALAIGVGTLPGQIFFAAESAMAVQLCWPLLLIVLTGQARRRPVLTTVLAAALYVTHPFAIALLGLLAAVAALVALRPGGERGELLIGALFGALAVAAAVQFVLFGSNYERDRLTLATLQVAYSGAVAGLPLLGLAGAWLTAALLLAPATPLVRALRTTAILISGVALLVWGSSYRSWGQAIDFRFWTLVCTLPFMAAAVADALLPGHEARAGEQWPDRRSIAGVAALIFAVVLTVQSVLWLSLTERLSIALERSPWPCLSLAGDPLRQTPLNHWSVTALGVILQGRAPATIALPEDGCGEQRFADSGALAGLLPGHEPGSWFNLASLEQRLAQAETNPEGCTLQLTTGWYRTEQAGPFWWRWNDGRDPQLRILSNRQMVANLSGEAQAASAPAAISVRVNGVERATLRIGESGLQPFGPLPLPLERGTNLVQLVTDRPGQQVAERVLAFSLANVRLASGEPDLVCRIQR